MAKVKGKAESGHELSVRKAYLQMGEGLANI